MNLQRKGRVGTAWVLLGMLASIGSAYDGTLKLRRDSVIPLLSEDQLTFRDTRRGDEFSARVTNDRDLPQGTRFEGRVLSVRAWQGDRPGEMRLEFTRIVMPDGSRIDVDAVPVAWNEKYFSRRSDGTFEPKKGVKRENYVIGGIAGGLLIGSLIHKPFEAAFIGALAGILLGESENATNRDVVIRRGDRIGALIERDVELTFDEQRTRSDSRTDERLGDRDGDRSRSARIAYEDRDLRFDKGGEPFWDGDVVMVPLERTAGQLGLTVDSADGRDLILIEGDEAMAKLSRSSRDYRVNGERRTLARNLCDRGGVLYIPLQVLARLTRGNLTVDGTKLEVRE